MSRDTEKVFRELHAFLEGKEFANVEDTNKAIQEFMDRYNNEQRPVDDFGEDAWGYLDRAYEAETLEETLKYAKIALKLDKDLVDAELVIAEITAKGFHDLLKKYEQMIKKTEKRLKEEGFFEEDCVGHFWGILETRPYMRLRYHHMEGLISMGRYHQAIKNCEELLELCPGDNMGVRYRLISLYAFLEDEMNAMRLFKRYNKEESLTMHLPISVLYYKLGDEKKAKNYLGKAAQQNPHVIKTIKKFYKNSGRTSFTTQNEGSYVLGSKEEVEIEMEDSLFLYMSTPGFGEWALEVEI